MAMNKTIKYAIPVIALGLLTYQHFYRAPQQVCLVPHQINNGDEARYPDKRGSFAKGLKKNEQGLVDLAAFNQVIHTIDTRSYAEFNKIPWGTNPPQHMYTNLREALHADLIGKEAWLQLVPPPPALASAEKASEMIELYWHALLRDVPFLAFNTDEGAKRAMEDLSICSDFKGPRESGRVTSNTLFRAPFDGALHGPLISQFFYQDIPIANAPKLPQKYGTQKATLKNEFMTSYDEWLFIELGNSPLRKIEYDTEKYYIRNMRDLGNYVHQDPPQWHFMCTQLILLGFGPQALKQGAPELTASLAPAQGEFCKMHVGALISLTTEMCLRGGRYQKWFVQRTLRAEECGYLIDQQIKGKLHADMHQEVIHSQAVKEIFALTSKINNGEGTYLLPQQYPEGCPLHPTYPSLHASVAGGCITILKAFFNEDFVIPNPVVPSVDGTKLVPYQGESLTVGKELDKFASNIAFARNMAGVHYRSDAVLSLLMGEKVALAILSDWAKTSETQYSLTRFDGTKVTIG